MNNMKFPIIAFSQGLIFIFRNMEELTTCGTLALKNNFYNGMVIYDSEGKEFEVIKAKKIGHVGPFFGFRLFHSRKIRVSLELKEKTSKISLEQLKKKICDMIDQKKSFWSAAGDINDLKKEIQKAETFTEIIETPFLNGCTSAGSK